MPNFKTLAPVILLLLGATYWTLFADKKSAPDEDLVQVEQTENSGSNTSSNTEASENAAQETTLTSSQLKKLIKRFRNSGVEQEVLNMPDWNEDQVIQFAKSFIGTPHKMGGTTRNGLDCSGLVMISFKEFGVKLPRTAQEQARFGKIIEDKDDLEKGDLVFQYDTYTTDKFITHCGIYIGDGKFIHTSTSKGVTIEDINDPDYWNDRFIYGTRLKE